MFCECDWNEEHEERLYFLTMSDSESHSNGVCVCRGHLLEVLDGMLPDTASVDVQAIDAMAVALEAQQQRP